MEVAKIVSKVRRVKSSIGPVANKKSSSVQSCRATGFIIESQTRVLIS